MPQVSVLVTTYNNSRDLSLVLASISAQTFRDMEVVVCDDGSDDNTAEIVKEIRNNGYPFVLKHYDQPHKPFGAGQARNGGILASESNYIINIDGDIIMHPRFVESHMKYTKEDRIIFGGRVKLSEVFSKKLEVADIASGNISQLYHRNYSTSRQQDYAPIYATINDRISGIICQYFGGTYFPFPKFLNDFRTKVVLRNMQWKLCLKAGCNWSASKTLIKQVNGFDECFGLGGGEDGEFFHRIYNTGAEIVSVLSCAIGYHLYHPQGWQREGDLRDQSMVRERYTRENKVIRCKTGLAEHNYGGLI